MEQDHLSNTLKYPRVSVFSEPRETPFIDLSTENIDVAVLIPCYNESLAIAQVVQDFRQHLPYARIYVYDNNSSDNTSKIAENAGAIVQFETRQGKGNVVRRMFRDIDADYYVLVDGDGTYEASTAPKMLKLALQGHYDFVNGVRQSPDQGDTYRKGHRLGNSLFSGMVQLFFHDKVLDMLSGYKVLSKRFVKSFPSLSQGFEIETELTIHAIELIMPIAYMETPYYERPQGSASKLKTYSDGRKILGVVLNLYRQEHPFVFFLIVAIILALLSIGLSIPLIITFIQTGLVPRFPTAFLSVGIMLLSALSFFCGLILDTVTRGRREAKMLRYLSYPPYDTFKHNS